MPLLKRKRLEPIAPPIYDASKKESRNSIVWYSTMTNEIFKDYSDYLKRVSLYKKPVWQCESTGKSNLTYREAVKSEKLEKERVQDKLPEKLQKNVLLYIQFQTARLDTIVDDAYQRFVNRYVEAEVLNYTDEESKSYMVRVVGEDESQTDKDENKDGTIYYRVQFMHKNSDVIDKKKGIQLVPGDRLKRDRYAFSKNLLKRFIKEYTEKDTYIGAPWVVSDAAAKRFGIDKTLPLDLRAARDLAYSKSRRKRSEAAAAAANGTSNEIEADANNSSNADKKLVIIDARRLESTLKYPMEDLNVASYRRDPSGLGQITDMTPGTETASDPVQNPTGDMPLRPQPNYQSTIPDDCFGSFLMIWSFLSVFSKPLQLSPFTVDDFESALHHDSHCSIITESHVALLNAIIKQRDRLKKESLGHGSTAMAAAISLYGSGYQASRVSIPLPHQEYLQQESNGQYTSEDDDDEHIWKVRPPIKKRQSTVERGCGSIEVENIGFNWDNGTVDTEEERIGWEDILIGFINQLAPLESIDDIDRILNHLVPSASSTLEDREEAYTTLSVRDKIKIFELLIHIANESYVIKSYMDECQDQLTELRKQKIDLSRERRRIHAEKRELEEKVNESNAQTTEINELESSESENSNGSDSEDESLSKAQRQLEHNNRHESRQDALRRRQLEKEEREAKRMKLHHLQREEARIKNLEMKKRSDMRKRLEEDQRVLHKNEEQVERDMRKYSNHRIKPLGRDKFYNRYYYLDDIGGTLLHGSGRLYVQSPSDTDIMVLMERDSVDSLDTSIDLPCGRGGGVQFVSDLLKAQNMIKEESSFVSRVEKLKENKANTDEWWHTFDEPEDLHKLLEWLNPKGIREFRLKREIEKQLPNLINGMKKRISDQNSIIKHEITRRNTRSKAVSSFPPGSWLAYTNKLAYN